MAAARVGMPMMKLNRQPHFGKEGRSGNARAVLCEALEERQSSDFDLDSSKTRYNVYQFGDDGVYFRSGNELADYWENLAENHVIVDKNGKQKSLRSDACIGYAGICKPDKKFMDSLSQSEQLRFMQDSAESIREILHKRDLKVDSIVIHQDEGNMHLHYFGHDESYQLGKKIGLTLFRAMNETEYPKLMRSKGWEVESLKGYDLEYANSLKNQGKTEELEEYKVKHRNNRNNGKSAKAYKLEKIEKAQNNRETLLNALECDLESRRAEISAEDERLSKIALEQAEREKELKSREELEKELQTLKNGYKELEKVSKRVTGSKFELEVQKRSSQVEVAMQRAAAMQQRPRDSENQYQ